MRTEGRKGTETDRQDKTKLTVTFRNFANAPINERQSQEM